MKQHPFLSRGKISFKFLDSVALSCEVLWYPTIRMEELETGVFFSKINYFLSLLNSDFRT